MAGPEQNPPNHPTAGDGHWVLLSTNRGYSKSRQRSMKFDGIAEANEAERKKYANSGSEEEHVPAVTSKRQVRFNDGDFGRTFKCFWRFFKIFKKLLILIIILKFITTVFRVHSAK